MSWSPSVGFHRRRPKVERLSTLISVRLNYSKPIRGAQNLTPPKGVDLVGACRMARMYTAKRVRLDDPDFSFESFDAHDGASRHRRSKAAGFLATLQNLILKTENWDGTPRV